MAVIYARQSKDRNGDGAAVDRQLEACRALAAIHEMTVDVELVDNDSSASKGYRPSFAKLLSGVRTGEISEVVVWHTDRLYRRTSDLVKLTELAEKHPLKIVTVKSGDLDLNNSTGRMLAQIMGAVARQEVEHKGERQVEANAQRASKGEWQFSRRPYGYERRDGVVQVVPSEADVIREGYRRSLAGESGYSIVADWNARGIHAPGGKTWSITQLRNRLANPHYAGLIVHQGEVAGKGTHEPLVSEDQWREFTLQAKARSARKAGDNRTKYLLSGLARCGECGAALFARPEYRRQGGKIMTYQCTAKWCVSRKLVDVDEMVERTIVARLSRPDAAALIAPAPDTAPMLAEASTLRGRLDDLAALLAEGHLDAAAVREQSSRLHGRLEQLEATIAASNSSPEVARLVTASDVAGLWTELPLSVRRAVISTLVRVAVKRQKNKRVFDPEDVVIEWLTR